jgi:hypothetical protein
MGYRLVFATLLALLVAAVPAQSAVIHQPAAGASVQQGATLYFDWVWDSDEYATSAIVFTRSSSPDDPLWQFGPGVP